MASYVPHYPTIQAPREQDQTLLHIYESSNWDPTFEHYVAWNRCQIANVALFLSEFLDGSVVDDSPLSDYNFGSEKPCDVDW